MTGISEEAITKLFTDWTAGKLTAYFRERTDNLLELAEEVMLICLKEISHHNPAHLTNDAMRDCISRYDEWGEHIAAANRPLVIKFMHNVQILWHQCRRYKWYEECDPEDETKKLIDAIIDEDEPGQSFIQFLQSMFSVQ